MEGAASVDGTLTASTVAIRGADGDEIEVYSAQPGGAAGCGS